MLQSNCDITSWHFHLLGTHNTSWQFQWWCCEKVAPAPSVSSTTRHQDDEVWCICLLTANLAPVRRNYHKLSSFTRRVLARRSREIFAHLTCPLGHVNESDEKWIFFACLVGLIVWVGSSEEKAQFRRGATWVILMRPKRAIVTHLSGAVFGRHQRPFFLLEVDGIGIFQGMRLDEFLWRLNQTLNRLLMECSPIKTKLVWISWGSSIKWLNY